jgi:EAL domain-containing protein (putative c-di-GMP-specific phosphodiesterase class I)
MVLRMLEDLHYPPEHLCLEVTERCRLLDLGMLKNVVMNLKSRGVQFALDDFGTGFSAVGIIREIPFDTIKIDRGFVMNIEKKEQDRRLIGSIVGLTSIFGAKVCAEGVETAGMRDILRKYEVKSFQGYYYSKPIMLEQVMKWGS